MLIGLAERQAQDYLKNAGHIDKEIELYRQLLAQEHKRLQHLSKILQHDFTQLPSYKEYVQLVEDHIKKLQAERDNALFLIGKIKNDKYRTLLELLYFDGLTTEKAADKMFYSVTHINRLKIGALHVMAILMEQDDAQRQEQYWR